VDDGSTDNGAEVVRGYADPRIRLIQQANAGPGAARNRGLRESNGELIAFLDADDEWMPCFLGKSVDRLCEFPECAAAVSGYYEGADRRNAAAKLQAYGITEGVWRLSPDLPPRRMKQAVDSCNPAACLRREVVERYGGFYEKDRCTFGEDTYLWLQVLLSHKVFRTLEPLAWYHTEASELFRGRKELPSLKPILTDPIRRNCPETHRAALERCLACYTLDHALVYARAGDGAAARRIITRWPVGYRWNLDFLKVRAEIGLTPLLNLLRSSPLAVDVIRWLRAHWS